MDPGTVQPKALRLAWHWRALNAVLWCVIIALLLSPFFLAADLLGIGDRTRALHGRLNERLAQLVQADGINPITLSALAGHEVTRICPVPPFADVGEAALRYGINAAGLPTGGSVLDEGVPDDSVGLLLVGPSGEVTYGALAFSTYQPNHWRCQTGARLALSFASTSPLSGGVLTDLAASDLHP